MFRKSFVIPLIILAIAAPLTAQGIQKAQKLQKRNLKKELSLTPDQVRELKTIAQSNKAQRQAIGQERRQKAQSLRTLTAQSNPNPTDVGNAVLALKQVRSEAQTMRQQALEKFKSDLTPDQVKTLEQLQARRKGN